jgi:hypothetical protein
MCTCAGRYTVHAGRAAIATPTVTPSTSQARLALRNALTNRSISGRPGAARWW